MSITVIPITAGCTLILTTLIKPALKQGLKAGTREDNRTWRDGKERKV
jgi:hypothetical protein